jgi:GAF domain-containing protein
VTGSVGRPSPPGARKALDELARLLMAEEETRSVLVRVLGLLTDVLPAGAEASVTVVRDQRPTTAASTGELALRLDDLQYGHGYGPCMDAALSGQFIEITDARNEERWPEYVPALLEHGALSALAAPVPAVPLAACLNVYSPVAGAFTDHDRREVSEFAAYAGLALTNMDALQDARDQAENMRAAMRSRAVIEQAKGILMERHKLTPDQAFRLLADASMRTHQKVRDLAEHLVLTGEISP